MDDDRIGLVLVRVAELKAKITNCIQKSATKGENESHQDSGKGPEARGYPAEDDDKDEEAQCLLNIGEALESLEAQLSSLQALQQQQGYEKEVSLAGIRCSQKKLIEKLKDYKGEELEVINEAIAFAGETVEDSNDLLLPPYPSRLSHTVVSQFPQARKKSENGVIIGVSANVSREGSIDSGKVPLQPDSRRPFSRVKLLIGAVAKAALTVVGVIAVLNLAGYEPKLRKRSNQFKFVDLFQLQEKGAGGSSVECPSGKVPVVENGETRCLVKERVEIPFDTMVATPDSVSELGRRQITNGKAGPYVWQTYEEVYNATLRLGSAIRHRGVNPGDTCGIYGSNCPEWIMAMEACNSQAVTYVPLYDTLGANAVEFIINHAEVSIAFVQESKIPSVLKCLPRCNTHLKTIVSFGKISSTQKQEAEELNVSCFSWEEFSFLGHLNHELPPKQKAQICTIMYTSGTTGEPKGVILSNEALVAEVLSIDYLLMETDRVASGEDTYFSFLPLAHVYDQIIETYCIYKGAAIGFWQGDVRYLIDDLLHLKPTFFCGVPRIYDRMYTGIMEKISARGSIRKKLFEFAYNYKLRSMQNGFKLEEAAPLLDKLVFDKIKQGFGGKVRTMFSGAAPLPKHVEEFLRVACCCAVSQGYGLTESCGGCFTSLNNDFSMVGTVGVPFPTIEARLESVPELGYDALANIPRGEICLRGKTLFSGYHKRPDLTDDVLVDGWFHTGDIGEFQQDGTMKIIDRKKNIFKLSQGEYVAVESLESTYSRCPIVTSIWVYGNSFESFLVAVASPEKKALEDWAIQNHQDGDFKSLCNNIKARKYILDELNSTAKKHQLRGFEMLRAVHLDPIPFDIERDLVTPTFKLKRPQLLKHYKDYIDQLYLEAKEQKA